MICLRFFLLVTVGCLRFVGVHTLEPSRDTDVIRDMDPPKGESYLKMRDGIAGAGKISEFAIAVALDKAVNGTSLMLLLDIAGTLLLFPGDALGYVVECLAGSRMEEPA